MKSKFVISLSGFFLAILCTTAKGQSSMVGDQPVRSNSSQAECIATSSMNPSAGNKPGQNILRNFDQKFENITGATWYESSFGFVLKFNLKGIDYRVDFDKKGNWISTIRNYDELKLPVDVRRLIHESYNDHSITLVQEIETAFNPLTFVVHLDGKKDIIQLLVSGDEMQVYQRFSKPHADGFTSKDRN